MLSKEDEFFCKIAIEIGILTQFQIDNIKPDFEKQQGKTLSQFLIEIELLMPWDLEKIELRQNELRQVIQDEIESRKKDASQRLKYSASVIHEDLTSLIIEAREIGASDLHLCVGLPPLKRKNRELSFLRIDKLLMGDYLEEVIFSSLTKDQKELALKNKSLDFCIENNDVGRLRCCIYKQLNGWEMVLRVIPQRILTYEELKLPNIIKKLTTYQQGLILVTGPTGSGKTTTLAAIVDLINKTRKDHIITVEDPIEFIHRPINCQVTQRQLGDHTQSFKNSLKAALREDPDIIMIGEMRNKETMAMAISAAETGHLVLATMPTSSAVRTINSVIDFFPPDQQGQVRAMIADSIRGIVSQQLIPNKINDGMELALEILVFDSAVSAIVRQDQLFQLTSIIQTGKANGMMLMDDSLFELVKNGTINVADAHALAEDKEKFEKLLEEKK